MPHDLTKYFTELHQGEYMNKVKFLALMVLLGITGNICVGMDTKKPSFLRDIENQTKNVIQRLVKTCQDKKKEIEGLVKKIRDLENAAATSNNSFNEQKAQWEQRFNQQNETNQNNLGLKDKLIKELNEKIKELERDLTEAYRIMGNVNEMIINVPKDI